MEPLDFSDSPDVPRAAKYLAGIAYVAVLVAALVAFRVFEQDAPHIVIQVLLGALWGIPVALIILALGFVYADAKSRGMPAVRWTFLTALLVPGAIGFVIYFLFRKPLRSVCPRCAAPTRASAGYCPQCGAALRPGCPKCRRPARAGDRFCEACGTALAQGADPDAA